MLSRSLTSSVNPQKSGLKPPQMTYIFQGPGQSSSQLLGNLFVLTPAGRTRICSEALSKNQNHVPKTVENLSTAGPKRRSYALYRGTESPCWQSLQPESRVYLSGVLPGAVDAVRVAAGSAETDAPAHLLSWSSPTHPPPSSPLVSCLVHLVFHLRWRKNKQINVALKPGWFVNKPFWWNFTNTN